MARYSRREFLQTGSAALAGASLAPLNPARGADSSSQVPPSDRLNFGVIGCKGMGWSNLQAHRNIDGVECIALCDVDQNVLDERSAELAALSGQAPAQYEDYRRMLENDDIDFVVISTPDHWHCLQTVDACEAGKDVYIEKPLANSIGECYVMEEAAERTGSVVQVGQWQRSDSHWEDAIQFVRSGELGNIRVVKTWAYQGWMGAVTPQPDQPAPPGVNYDMWLGPAPERPFNPNRFHFDFRWYWDYAGGLMADWGVHLIDFALYGMDVQGPNSVTSIGGKFGFPDDASETPDTQQAIYEFDDFSMIWEHATAIDNGPYGRNHGVAFIGNNGTVVIDRGGWEIMPEVEGGRYMVEPRPRQTGQGGLDRHAANFVECIRTRERPACPIDVGSNVAVNAHLGNIAFRLGRHVQWDGEARQFIDDPEADAFIWPEYRDPWQLPRTGV